MIALSIPGLWKANPIDTTSTFTHLIEEIQQVYTFEIPPVAF